MPQLKKLSYSFYQNKTIDVAKGLLGQILVHRLKKNRILKGKIVETEAYLGLKDPCCHSFHGKKTKRIQVMYESGGLAYVYLIYGIHYCFNVVTRKKNSPEAVLIRALEPLEGRKQMQRNRSLSSPNRKKCLKDTCLTNGPAKLCLALGINAKHNGTNLMGNTLYIEKNKEFTCTVRSSPRVGLPKNKEASLWPLRFYVKNNLYVSKP